jgi:deoxyribodipyrimidine photolyase-related protein
MKAYEQRLQKAGHEVRYVDYAEGVTTEEHVRALNVEACYFCDPVDFLISKRLARSGVTLHEMPTPMFLSPNDWLNDQFVAGKRPFMARFYERQRKRMNLLVDDKGEPEGGRWSYDDENRLPMPKRGGLDIPDPKLPRQTAAVREAMDYVERIFPDAYGSTKDYHYPVTHQQAKAWLDDFLAHRFANFGPYEDAISGKERLLFHSVLTPMLNIGLLTPEQVIKKALECDVPLNSLEGFIRQIVGWREFIRGAYRHHGVPCRTTNFWAFEDRPIPQAFYDGTTGIDPIDTTIRRVLDHGYCHHIERLMILGNFMLLCRFHPDRVYAWFMELFVDAYDWVMVPNVYGMSQFADGGLFTTKPYISGSNYVRKMSDYKKGPWCDVWDGLFWTFIADHEDYFRSQHRLGMMTRQLDKMPAEKWERHQRHAAEFLESLA